MTVPWIKICGVTRPEDAALAADLGAGFVGINFWPRSPRFVADLVRAREIADAARAASGAIRVAGVFVDQAPAWIDEVVDRAGLDLVQLHGDEPDEVVGRYAQRALRTLRAEAYARPTADSGTVHERSNGGRSLRQSVSVFAFLVESPAAGALRGGSGVAWDWSAARELIAALAPAPVFVAGGVRPENVREAVAGSGARGVDVASGVESAPGLKDPDKLKKLFEVLGEAVGR
ncbi:MAG: N-(5'-phosphoribosyl)anthranilate isomerase [Acidobacteriota bacterium]